MEENAQYEIATLAGGCFWCLEAPFGKLLGVKDVVSGYMGGHTLNPDYKQVCTGETGHAEVIQIHFDPSEISYRGLLEIFFALHDPTTRNRQGNDIGTQYRSAVFYHSDMQRDIAQEVITELTTQGTWSKPVITEVVPAETFYPAEEYHQHYFERNPQQPYCQVMIGPKLAKLRAAYREKLKPN
jgi:peptide-methionine (S)-S-oxide reductase